MAMPLLAISEGKEDCEDHVSASREGERKIMSSSRVPQLEGVVGDMWRDIQGAKHWKGLLDPIHPLLKAEVMRYGDFAQQCYDWFDNSQSSKYYTNCKRSKSSLTHRLRLGQCGGSYQVTKYIYANTRVFGEEDKMTEMGAWIGFIAVCKDAEEIRKLGRRDIVVAWRGTETPQEWIQNLRDILVPIPGRLSHNIQTNSRPNVRIEKGFMSCYTSIDEDSVRCRASAREIVMAEITRLLEEHKDEENDLSITFTGHSLGGALATISAYDIKQMCMLSDNENTRNVPVTVFSFASPRVGNMWFAQHMEEIGVKVLRVVNRNDLVPNVPGVFVNENMGRLAKILCWLPWTYFHVGVQITVDSNRSPLLKETHNPADFHSLEVYLHSLDGFQGNNRPFKSLGLRDPAMVNKSSDLLIEDLQVPSHWWPRRNKEIVKRIDGALVYSPATPTPPPPFLA
uniref:Fungal lipase-type domain-containing protein n=1 Tax=Araucaria cunninghamii TaxID=56994 RepID=A0A0D6QZW2_ARACU